MRSTIISIACLCAFVANAASFEASSVPGEVKVTPIDPRGATSVVVCVEVPIRGIDEIWMPDQLRPLQGRKWWLSCETAPQCDFPFIAYFAANGENACSFGASSIGYDNAIGSKINQEKGVFELTLTVTTAGEPIKPFEVTVDRRAGDWTEALASWRDGLYAKGGSRSVATADMGGSRSVATADGTEAVPLKPQYPDGAWKSVYCTWYAAHADFDQDWVEREAKLAAALGFKTFILDDGWSYDEKKRVNPETIVTWYRDIGRWDSFSKAKFPDFQSHRERMRKFGLNYLVWVAPYLIGSNSPLYREGGFEARGEMPIEGKVIADVADEAFMRKVDDQLVELMKSADIDGLKIDYLDSARPSVSAPHAAAARRYMATLMKRLREVKPNGLYEFRQSYATPYMASLGTQFRASDVPFDWQGNVLELAQIRLAMGDRVPIHADPIYYADCETEDNIDRHFMAAMAGVPMVSMDLEKMTPSARERVKRWLDFYAKRIEQFQREGHWSVRYRNGSLAAIWSVRGNAALALVTNPGFVPELEKAIEGKFVLLLNLTHETVMLRGTAVGPASYRDITSAARRAVPACDPRTMGPTSDYAKYYMARQNWFMEHKNAIGEGGIVFLGDSITELFQGTKAYQEHFAQEPGKEFKALNLGNDGERTENVLWHIESGQLDGYTPKAIVVAIGTNNVGNGYPKEDIWQALELIIDRLKRHQPGVPILVQGIFPRAHDADDVLRRRVAECNIGYKRIAAENGVKYLAIWDEFLSPDGTIGKDVLFDGLHPTEKAAKIWADHLVPVLREMTAGKGK